MAMSRFLSQSLPRSSPHYPAAALMSHHRHHSSKSRRAQLNEVTEIDQTSSSSADPGVRRPPRSSPSASKGSRTPSTTSSFAAPHRIGSPSSPGPRTGSHPVPPPCAEAAPLPNTELKA
ncbi:hypothetical protein PHJA_001284500 [Phtheirospermum japonicum]|uniref:Uncharacterized protein n=1 Tax=Phtheirospermum japonicum TaxID=374723 RepID=A0A830C7X9_9LAMI|nr:hypothetical protein PHJA_001284500 [Phtheirospermum japonicum]